MGKNSAHHTTTIGLNSHVISVGKLNRTSYDNYCPKLNISRKNSTLHHTTTVSLNLVLSVWGDSTHHTTTIGLNLILVGKLNRTSYDLSFYKLSIIREISTCYPPATVSLNLVLRGGILNTSYDHYWSKLNISGKSQHIIRPLLVQT